jgi:threonine synthase
MMNYTSTRGNIQQTTAEEAILQGLSPDGGLYIPLAFPSLPDGESLRSLSYPDLLSTVLSPFFSLISKEELKESAEQAYQSFSHPVPVQLVEREDMAVLELFHGPTLAFKDMALCFLPHLMQLAKKHLGREENTLLLTATSGDTGISAIEGFSGVEGFSTIVFYPKDGVSPLQERQMLTTRAKNATVIGLRGNFDDAQRGVKQMLADVRFHQRLQEKGWRVASANSINLGRLLAQIVYYYASLHVKSVPLRFSVPTGNFGNVLAAHWARKMGAPIAELLIATNENDVLDRFFQSGVYDAGRELIRSQSPSMDILVSSNLERLLHETGGVEEVRRAMNELETSRRFHWSHPFSGFRSGSVQEYEVREEIRRVWSEEQILLDPHTAVASSLLHRRKEKGIVVATASPFKFPSFVLESLGKTSSHDPIQDLEALSALTDLPLPEPMQKLEDSQRTQERICRKEDMEANVLEVLHV